MTRHVTLIGGDSSADRQLVTVDRFNNALVTMGEVHENIHRGIFYTVSHYEDTITAAGTLDIVWTVTTAMHARAAVFVSADFLVEFYAASTLNVTPGGTALTAYNRNGFSSNVSDVVALADPTLDADGTLRYTQFVPGGSKAQATGGDAASFEEWILPPATYLLRLTNITGQTEKASIAFDFYHPSQSSDTP